MRRKLLLVCTLMGLAGCKVGPNYSRPQVPVPPQIRGGEQQPTQTSFGDVKWFDLFQDDVLRGLIKEALVANYDIRMAAQRVIAAEGQLGATRSLLYPEIGAQGSATRSGYTVPVQSQASGFLTAAWELDLFGKMRRASEAARADLLSLEENRKAVMQVLVAEVATAYFDLREYDAELEYVVASIKARQESLRLVTARSQTPVRPGGRRISRGCVRQRRC